MIMSIIVLSHSCQTFGWTFYRGFFQTMLGVKSDSEASATSVCVCFYGKYGLHCHDCWTSKRSQNSAVIRGHRWWQPQLCSTHCGSHPINKKPMMGPYFCWKWTPKLPNSFCGTLPTWHLLTQGERVAAGAQIPTASDAGMVDGGVQGSWGRQPFGQSYVGIGCI